MSLPYCVVEEPSVYVPPLELVLVVKYFLEFFPNDMPIFFPEREIDFCIDLLLDMKLISIPPYR